NLGRNQHAEFALGALHFDLATADGTDLYAGGNWNRFATNTWHCFLISVFKLSCYQASQRISPPTLDLRAERPVITPLGVVRMLMPRPPTTGRTSREPR